MNKAQQLEMMRSWEYALGAYAADDNKGLLRFKLFEESPTKQDVILFMMEMLSEIPIRYFVDEIRPEKVTELKTEFLDLEIKKYADEQT
ncbi:hypothetical protein PHIM7_146 [Sinorhizobium phage phiM7]|uniref:Uncharacterized protein n=2 Tax=Emdodecavirus TaxID=1980937 RepID=S5MPU0_9CAUD|nr:hypothetical protein AB690_gp351 [Sinorhizobium phage phiM12]YP_009601271.1 hypothetical protein FDH46_gp332 [Sinorhizobium phage phiM7]AGR47845.1 hypothetical protein SmphiM12_213 [Sinorhizobium phage phiM12]AKF12692.1 hypothetical protein PHIM7_146 [Sinorhizobium phage phiM7]AKF13051.1 hypothetical protein PHIM19_146 [Sinorhizobium phage phiM19]